MTLMTQDKGSDSTTGAPPKAEYQVDDIDQELDDDDFDDAHKDLYMTFRIDNQNYGIQILDVNEIVGLHTITEVPDVPPYVKGMINLRGTVIPVIDVRLRFNMEEREYDSRTCVVVVTVTGATVGLVVDRVNEVGSFSANEISAPPSGGKHRISADYISGMGKKDDQVTILLDTEKLLHERKG